MLPALSVSKSVSAYSPSSSSQLKITSVVVGMTAAIARPPKSHRCKSGKRGESCTRGARGSPPRLIADDPIHVDTPILLVGFDSGFGLGPEVAVHRTRIGRRS